MNDVGFQPGPVTRPVGLETEFGVLRPGDAYANPVVLSTRVVEVYCAGAGVPPPLPVAARHLRWMGLRSIRQPDEVQQFEGAVPNGVPAPLGFQKASADTEVGPADVFGKRP